MGIRPETCDSSSVRSDASWSVNGMAWSVQFDKSLSIDETDRLMRRAELCWQHYVEFASQLKGHCCVNGSIGPSARVVR